MAMLMDLDYLIAGFYKVEKYISMKHFFEQLPVQKWLFSEWEKFANLATNLPLSVS
jgi:hypothetical protein